MNDKVILMLKLKLFQLCKTKSERLYAEFFNTLFSESETIDRKVKSQTLNVEFFNDKESSINI